MERQFLIVTACLVGTVVHLLFANIAVGILAGLLTYVILSKIEPPCAT